MGRKRAAQRYKKNNKITDEDEVVVLDDDDDDDYDDDLHESSGGEKILSRSSPSRFSCVMGELMPIVGERQKTRISETPFAKWVDMPVLARTSGRIDHLLSRFDASSCSFVLSPGVAVPFRSPDFSVVLGLRHGGPPVDIYLKRPSEFLSRHFSGKASGVAHWRIIQKIRSLAGSDDEGEVDDFVRFFILLVFNYVVFPTGNAVIPGFVFSYLDDLTTFFDHAWGDAAFHFLHRGMCNLGRKRYVDGCVVGLMALVYESLPTLGVGRGSEVYPRLFRWADSKIPSDSAEAEYLLKSIDSTQVLSIRPSHEEEELLGPKPPGLTPQEETSKVRRLKDAVISLMDENKALRRKCAELEGTSGLQDVVTRQADEIVALKRKCAELEGTSGLQDVVARQADEIEALKRKCAELEGTSRLQDVVTRQADEIEALKRKCAELEGTSRLQDVVTRQADEIEALKQRCAELEGTSRLQDTVTRQADEIEALKRRCVELEGTSRLQDTVIRQMGEITALKRKCAELKRSGSDEEAEVADRASKQRRWPKEEEGGGERNI